MRYYDKNNNNVVVEGCSPTPDFWDAQWKTEDIKKDIKNGCNERFVSRTTAKFIKPNKFKRILEGGCGKGHFVYSLKSNGYDSFGIDFAKNTIEKIKNACPELKVSYGDVRKLNFPDNFFDGYWSLGVIEHFFNGYGDILDEMHRVIKKGGFLFITFPHLSFLRKLKIKLKLYPDFQQNTFDEGLFYYFALDPKKVMADVEKLGFKLVYTKSLEGLKGLKDEVSFLKKPLQKIYDNKNIIFKILNFLLARILAPFSAHVILLVFKKDGYK